MKENLHLVLAFFGAPGAGKGTQSMLLKERRDFMSFSVGGLLRDEVARKSAIGEIAASYMNQGKLVPDYVVNDAVKSYFVDAEDGKIILDGFPRTVGQAKELRTLLSLFPHIKFRALQFDLDVETLVSRIHGRFMCSNCQAVYNKHDFNKKFVCPKCGSKRITEREDDTDQIVYARVDEYSASINDLVDFYQSEGLLSVIDGSGTIESVYTRVCSAIDEFFK